MGTEAGRGRAPNGSSEAKAEPAPLPRPLQLLVALAFCALVVYALAGRLLPWALGHLPLAAPLAVVFAVALASVVWATVDVLRGRVGSR